MDAPQKEKGDGDGGKMCTGCIAEERKDRKAKLDCW